MIRSLGEQHPYPVGVAFELTQRCNLTCKHCFKGEARASPELSLNQLELIFDELVCAGTLFLGLTGGEPAVRRDLEEIVQAATRRGFVVKLKTNATLLDDQRLQSLHANGLRYLETSLYHDDPAEHDRFVGRQGSFDRTLTALTEFARLGGFVSVVFTAMTFNHDRTPAVLDLCQERGFTYRVSPTVFGRDDGDLSTLDLLCDSGAVADVLSEPRILDASRVPESSVRPADRPVCDGGVDSAFFMPNGDVRLCQRLPLILGNAVETPFRELWARSPERRAFRELRWGDLPECADCELSGICWRCPASALLETGSMEGVPKSDCQVARVLADLRQKAQQG